MIVLGQVTLGALAVLAGSANLNGYKILLDNFIFSYISKRKYRKNKNKKAKPDKKKEGIFYSLVNENECNRVCGRNK